MYGANIDDVFIEQAVEQVARLTALQVSGCGVNGTTLSALGRFKELVFLNLSETSITDEVGESISQLKSLRDLWLSRTHVTDRLFTFLRPLPDIRCLLLNDTQVGDAACEYIAQCPELREVRLDNTRVTGAAFISLAKAPHLESLNLNGTPLDGDKLRDLWGCKPLQMVSVERTGLSLSEIANVAWRMPTADTYPDITCLEAAGIGCEVSLRDEEVGKYKRKERKIDLILSVNCNWSTDLPMYRIGDLVRNARATRVVLRSDDPAAYRKCIDEIVLYLRRGFKVEVHVEV